MIDWARRVVSALFGLPSASRQTKRVRLRARYDAAQTTDDNRRHWSAADSLSAAAANSLAVRKKLRERSRYECANNGYAQGLILSLANDLVSTGPTLQVAIADQVIARRIEAAWSRWAEQAGFGRKLHTMAQAKKRDGEAFILLSASPNHWPVSLDLRLIECDQVTHPTADPAASQPGFVDGVEVGSSGEVLGYHVLRYHPGDTLSGFPPVADLLATSAVIHWYRHDRPGQYRGVPEITAALPLFSQLRRFTLATLTAAETAADFAAVLETDAPADTESEAEVTPFETMEIERGMMTTLPSGAKLGQLKAEHPTTTYDSFKRELLKEIGRCTCTPFNIIAGDSSSYNYSSARLDHLLYRAGIRVEREHCRQVVLDPIYRAWWAEAILSPEALADLRPMLGTNPPPHRWYWPGYESIDPAKEAAADAQRLATGTVTLAELLAERGIDLESHLAAIAREREAMRRVGLAAASPAPSPPAEEAVA